MIATDRAGQPHWEGKWRHHGRQVKRRLGPAHLIRNGDGWKKAPGRAPEGVLDRTDASIALRALIASHAAESEPGAHVGTKTFASVAEAWYERAERRGRKPSTLTLYRQMLDAYILGQPVYKPKKIPRSCPFKDKPVDRLTKADLRDWLDPIDYSPQKGKLCMAIRSICAFAVGEGWMAENVALAVECRAPSRNGDYEFFSHAEIERLIAAAADQHDAALYAAAAMTGLRKGELFGLQWRDIDFAHKRVVVRRNLTGGQLGTPKNGHSRIVPLVPELATRLKQFKRRYRLQPAATTVFSGHPDAAIKRYRKALTKAKLRKLRFHSLRHSFGSHAVNVATLVQVRDWMGHGDLRTTGRYLHAKHLDSDAELLAQAFS